MTLHQAKSPSRSILFVPRKKLHRLLASNLSIYCSYPTPYIIPLTILSISIFPVITVIHTRPPFGLWFGLMYLYSRYS